MSLQPREPNDGVGDTNRAERLQIWSCVNCRRRKVRCDRYHPCAPCTRNKAECVFPVSGRLPRRSRDGKDLNPRAQKQAELLGRLRRLESMVGNLGSQVEAAAAVSQGNHPAESSKTATNTTNTTSATGITSATSNDGVRLGSSLALGTLESLPVSEGFGELVVAASNGDLVLGNRFWTVFCTEVYGPALLPLACLYQQESNYEFVTDSSMHSSC